MTTYIRASDGNGEAVTANVVADREIGDMQINVDSVLNWPYSFIATSGTLVGGELTDVTVFYGYLAGSIITIDRFAPGYTDKGNTENQLIVLKPTTAWADEVALAAEDAGGKVTIGPTPPASPKDGELWGDTSDSGLADLVSAVGNLLYPVGSIYMSVSATSPGTTLGFGTWVAWGSGRVPVGVDVAQSEFSVVEKTGGHKLMQSHTHTRGTMNITGSILPSWNDSSGGGIIFSDAGSGAIYASQSGTSRWTPSSSTGSTQANKINFDASRSWTGATSSAGGGNGENLQPYITAYMWKRTA